MMLSYCYPVHMHARTHARTHIDMIVLVCTLPLRGISKPTARFKPTP